MHRQGWTAVMALVALSSGCELVASLQDKYLVGVDGSAGSPLDASTSASDDGEPAGGDSSQADVTQAVDGMATIADGPALDSATLDASSLDAPLAEAAPPDPTAAPDAGTTDPSVPCAQQPPNLFCDDFDQGTTPGAPWTYELTTADGGALAFATDAYASPSRSLLVTSPATTGRQQLVLGEVLTPLNAQLRLAFDLRVDMDSFEGPPLTTVAQVLATRNGEKLELDFQLLPPSSARLQAFLGGDGGAPVNLLFPMPALRAWTRIVVAYDASSGVAVYEDGQPMGTAPAGPGGTTQTQFQIGMVYQTAPGTLPIRLELDNVVFRGN
jgi:hypothetical protein